MLKRRGIKAFFLLKTLLEQYAWLNYGVDPEWLWV